jgi:beta-lactamase regulating signal transducer with metallopeptidase domain
MIGEWLSGFAHGVAGDWLIDTLLVTAALMAAVLLLRRPVAKVFGAEMAYLLWVVPLARLFMPPLTQTIEVPVSEPLTDTGAMAMPVGGMAAPADAVPEGAFSHGLLLEADWFSIGITVWLCGAGVFLIAQLSAYLQNRRELLEDAVELSRIDDIRVIEIAGISGPFAFGLWRKYIALPVGFTRAYNPMERELALAHERSHHRAGDLWANFAALAMLSLHWFNPIAWMAWRAFRFDQEAACDARVLRSRSATERTAYARAIAKAATGQTLAFASPLNPKEKIVERLKIMKQKETSRTRKWLGSALIGTGLVSAMAMTATVSYAIQPVMEPGIPEAPVAPSAPDAPSVPPAPSVEDGMYVYRIREADGKQVVLRLDRPARQAELDRMVADAERSRAEADRSIAEADRAAAEADWAVADADRASAATERQAATLDRATRSRAEAMDRATRSRAEAMDRAQRLVVVRSGSADNYVIDMGEGRKLRVQTSDCKGASKSAAFMTHTETKGGNVTRTKVVTCGQVMPDEAAIAAQIEKSMTTAQQGLAIARAEIRSNTDLSAAERAEALREIDDAMRELRTEMADARRELRRDMQQMRRELQTMPAPPAPPAAPAAPSW